MRSGIIAVFVILISTTSFAQKKVKLPHAHHIHGTFPGEHRSKRVDICSYDLKLRDGQYSIQFCKFECDKCGYTSDYVSKVHVVPEEKSFVVERQLFQLAAQNIYIDKGNPYGVNSQVFSSVSKIVPSTEKSQSLENLYKFAIKFKYVKKDVEKDCRAEHILKKDDKKLFLLCDDFAVSLDVSSAMLESGDKVNKQTAKLYKWAVTYKDVDANGNLIKKENESNPEYSTNASFLHTAFENEMDESEEIIFNDL